MRQTETSAPAEKKQDVALGSFQLKNVSASLVQFAAVNSLTLAVLSNMQLGSVYSRWERKYPAFKNITFSRIKPRVFFFLLLSFR